MNAPKRHEAYRTFGAFKSFAEADAELRAYWWSRAPEERMEALEGLRVRIWGEDVINAPIVRCYGWRKSGEEPDQKNLVHF